MFLPLYHMKRGKRLCLNLFFSIETLRNDPPTLMVNFKLKMEMLMSAIFDTHFRNNEII